MSRRVEGPVLRAGPGGHGVRMDLLLRYPDPGSTGHPLHDRYAQVTTGTPGRCPACGDFGVVDALDVRRALQTQHCRACRYRWEYRFADDGTILEVRGIDPLPAIAVPDEVAPAAEAEPIEADPAPDPAEPAASPGARRRVVVRRRQRPLRARRPGDTSAG